jgi:hypothetical protein
MRFFKRKNERLENEPETRGVEDLDVIAMEYVKANGGECLDDLDTPTFIRQAWLKKQGAARPRTAEWEATGASRLAFVGREPISPEAASAAMQAVRLEAENVLADYFELASWFTRFRILLTTREWRAGVEVIESIGRSLLVTKCAGGAVGGDGLGE